MAKEPTAKAIQDFLHDCNQRIVSLKVEGKLPKNFYPLWSLDNTNIHKCAIANWGTNPDLTKLGIDGQLLLPPPYSPDLHKVVEHVHAQLCQEFYKWLHGSEPLHDIQAYFAQLEKIFKKIITAKSIQKDVQSLLQTYDAVIECEGQYPPKKFR